MKGLGMSSARQLLWVVVVPSVLLAVGWWSGVRLVAVPVLMGSQARFVAGLLVALPVLMGYLVVLGVVRMVREFRGGRLGSRFQARLFLGFLAVVLLAVVPLFAVLAGLLRRSLEAWGTPEMRTALGAAYALVQEEEEAFRRSLREAASALAGAGSEEGFRREAETRRFVAMAALYRNRRPVFRFVRTSVPAGLVTEAEFRDMERQTEMFLRRRSDRWTGVVGLFRYGDRLVAVVTEVPVGRHERAVTVERAWLAYGQMDLLGPAFRRVFLLSAVFFLLTVLFVALVLSIWLSRQIAKPVYLIYEGMRNIAAGKTDFVLEYGRKDEMASLVTAFNTMAKEVAFNQRAVVHSRHLEAWKKAVVGRLEELRARLAELDRLGAGWEAGTADSARVREAREAVGKALAGLEPLVEGPLGVLRKEDLNEMVREVMEMFQGVRTDISFYVELDPSIPLLGVNRPQMQQAILNLVKNAVEALPEGKGRVRGQVRVVTAYERRLAGGTVRIEVSDNGPGIPPEAADRVFEPYYTTKPGKQGLGLTVVARVVEEHGGRVRHRRVDGRTVFTVELPA